MEETNGNINNNSEEEKVADKKKKIAELIKLIEKAKGPDRSYMAYAKAAGISTAAFSRIKNGDYIPAPGTMKKLTSETAAPRGGVTYEDLMRAAGYDVSDVYNNDIYRKFLPLEHVESSDSTGITSDDREIVNTKMPEPYRLKHREADDPTVEYVAAIYTSLVENGVLFKKVQPDADVFKRRFRPDLAINIFDKPINVWMFEIIHWTGTISSARSTSFFMRLGNYLRLETRDDLKLSIVINDEKAFDGIKEYNHSLAFRGELSVILYNPEKRIFTDEVYLSNYNVGDASREIYLVKK